MPDQSLSPGPGGAVGFGLVAVWKAARQHVPQPIMQAEIAAHFGHEHSILENQSARPAKPAWGARKTDFFTASLGASSCQCR